MKKTFILPLMLIMFAASFGQQINPTSKLTSQDFLKKSKNQKTAAWLLVGAGTAMMVTGSILWSNEVEETVENDPLGVFYAPYTTTKGTGLTIAGLIATAGSIPLFIASGKNKRKAMRVSAGMKMEKTPTIQKQSFVQTSFPAVTVKIGL